MALQQHLQWHWVAFVALRWHDGDLIPRSDAQTSSVALVWGEYVEEVERMYPRPSLVHHAHKHVYPERLFLPYATPYLLWEKTTEMVVRVQGARYWKHFENTIFT